MTTLGANVSLIPESVAYAETLEDYIITCDYNIPPNKRAAQVPKLGDSFPGETAPWDHIIVETGSLTSRKSPDQGAYITGVRYAKAKIPFTSGIEGLKEVYRKPETGRRGRYAGTRVFLAVDSTAEATADTLLPELLPMAATGSWATALLREKQIERNWRTGLAKITALYDSYAPIGEIIVVNKGILEADASAVMVWNRDVVPGTTYRIDEIYREDGVRKQWVRVKGNNGWPLVRADFRIRAVLTASNLSAVKGLVGAVNNNVCTHILGAAERTLWFNKFSMRQRKRGGNVLFDCIIGLAYDPLEWDAETIAQLQKYVVCEEEVLGVDGVTPTGELMRTGSWVPVEGVGTKPMPFTDYTASFTLLDGYLS